MAQSGAPSAAGALRELAESYWYCVYAWWRRAGLDAARAPRATLASFDHWLGDAPPQAADAGIARMREWIPVRLAELSSLGVKRRGEPPIAIDPVWAEERYAGEPDGDAEAIFQRRWALTVLELTAVTLQAEYAARGEDVLFGELIPFGSFEPSDEGRYSSAAAATDQTSGAMRKAVFDFRTRQRVLLRAFVADTVADPAEIESEITALLLACDAPGPEAGAASLPTVFRAVLPDQMLARAMRSVKMSSTGAGSWTPPSDTEIARLFPQYEMLGLIGRGGMGAVYRARQVELDRHVAIKLLPLEVSVDKEFADRFRREARAMAKLSHPNIIAVHDFGTTHEGHLFFSMEFVEGANLHEIIHGPGITPRQALALAAQVCDALAYAHGKGVVHRDIKPANVMVDAESHVKVADFGLARLMEANPENFGMTVSGIVMGTPAYMAPEQTRGMNVDHRADIYSLGVMLYEMLCRETPQGVFDPPSMRAAVDVRVDHVVARAMAQQPERRFQSSTEMKLAVEHIRTTPMMRAGHGAPAALPPKPQSRTALYVGIAAVLVVLSMVFWPKTKPVRRPPLAAATPAKASSAPATPALVLASATPVPIPVVSAPPPPAVVVEPKMPEPPVVTAPPPEVPSPGAKGSAQVVQWLAQVESQFTAQYQSEAAGPFEKAVATLRAQYLEQVERGSTAATKAGKLDDSLAWRNEQARLTAGRQPHDAPDEPTDPAPLRQLRENWRKAFAKLDTERFAKAKAAHQRFDALLDRGQIGYTQMGRLDDAVLLKAKRDEIRAAWLTPPVDLANSKPIVAPRPLGTAMDTPKPNAGTLTGREAVAYLYGLGLETVFIGNDGKRGNIGVNSKPEEVPKDRVEITEIRVGRKRDETFISDDDFKKLGPQRKLTSIGVGYASLTGTGLAFLAGSPDLVTAEVGSSGLTDAVLEPLVGLRKLENLLLVGSTQPLAWTRLGELSALPNLTTFQTEHAEHIPPAVLARARKLQRLRLVSSNLTEEHFAAIGALADLDSFSLSGQGEAGAAGLRYLEKCTKLTALNLTGSNGIGSHLGFIGKMRKLTTLDFDGADAPGLAGAAGAPALREINLNGSYGSQGTSDEGLKAIAASFPRLETLLFRDAATRSVTPEGIRSLAKLPKLKSFTWGSAPVSVEMAAALAMLPALEHLSLRLGGLNETHLAELAKCKSLTRLDLSYGGAALTPLVIDALKNLRGLRDLDISADKHTAEQIAALRKALPKCVVKN